MKQLGELSVSDYMAEGAITTDDSQKLVTAIRLMNDNQLSVVPVVDQQGQVIGILSTSDLVDHVYEIQSDLGALTHVQEKTRQVLLSILMDHGDSTFVRDVMKSPVETVTADANMVIAARKLNEGNYHHLPVVDRENRPVGMLSTSDFVRAFADHGKLLAG